MIKINYKIIRYQLIRKILKLKSIKKNAINELGVAFLRVIKYKNN